MGDYVIISDATIDLSAQLVEKLGIRVIPMQVLLGGKEYVHYPDCRELSIDEFYRRLKAGEDAATTQISPDSYISFFKPVLDEGKDIIYICFSSGLSGTYNSACIAMNDLREDYPERKLVCIDSLCASIGEGLLVLNAAEHAAAGASFEEETEYIENCKTKCCHWFMVENLEQLRRGGRVSSIEAALGAALKICPILSTDREGKLRVVSKARGVKKAISFLKQRLVNEGYDLSNQTIILGHGDSPELAEMLRSEIMSEIKVKECVISRIGPIIGSHTGEGMCALTFLGENYIEI